MGKLDGKVAIVTGAGRGIGRGIAIVLAREGAKVVVASRTPSTVEEVVGVIKQEGNTALGVTCDVYVKEQLKALVDQTVKAFGTVDVLVNNAQSFNTRADPTGTIPVTPLAELSDEEWDWTYGTGVVATLRLMQMVFPYMKAQGSGRIINFGSRVGQRGTEYMAVYASCKEAIRGLSRSAAREWGPYGITVNIINPLVTSASTAAISEREPGRMEKSIPDIPMRRIGDAIRDAGPLVAFLASDEASYVTAQTIMLDGGRYTYA